MILKRFLAITVLFISLLLFNTAFAQTDAEQKYKDAIASADKYFSSGDYINAKAAYQYAAKLNPEAEYPKKKLKETVDKLREKMALMSEYNAELSEADKLFRAKDYESAKARYEAALKILPDEKYPKEKIDEINTIFEERAARQAAYDDAVARGDRGMQYKKYETAIKAYEKALKVFPDAAYPKEKIEEATKLAEEYNSVKLQYDEAITAADRLFNLKYYEKAKESYLVAKSVKPEEDYPEEQIAKIDKLLIKKNEYDKLISEADELYMSKNLAEAKSKYQAALKIYPSESYPKDMIDKMNEKLKELSSKDDLYNDAIASADAFFNSGDYANATKEYQNALSIKPDEQYPKTKIDEISTLLAKMDEADKSYNEAVQKGEQFLGTGEYEKAKAEFEKALALKPSEQMPKDKIANIDKLIAERNAVKGSYDNAIALADKALAEKNFEVAATQYGNALLIIPGDKYAQGKIKEVKKLKADFVEMQKRYNKVVSEADKLFDKKNFEEAKTKYTEAKKIDPSQTYPDDRLLVISQLFAEKQSAEENYRMTITLADNLFEQKKYTEALAEYENANKLKPGDKYPAGKIDEISKILADLKTKQENYDKALAAGDSFFEEANYEKALAEYQKAANLIPENEYPATKIAEINTILKERAAKGQQYATLVAEADKLFKEKSYQDAKAKYQSALEIQPGEPKPTEKITEIDNILADMKAVHESYDNAIAKGDNLFALKDYSEAKLSYMKASNIKPKEEYPKVKLTEIENLIASQKAQQAEYNRIIAAADRMMDSKEYLKAKEKYNEALGVLPNEQYPKDKLKVIADIILAQELAKQEAYNSKVSDADAFMANKQYEQAKLKYQEALKLKPEEEYPVRKIAEIERLVSDLATIKANYSKLIATADKSFKAKEYGDAKAGYVEAAALMPDETYPKDQIEVINKIFKAEQERIQQNYDKAIADADKFYSANVFGKALDSYRLAKKIKPDEDYPDEMVNRILKILDENAVRNVLGSPVTIANQSVEKFTFDPVAVANRKASLIYIKAKNITGNEFRVVMSYGKGNAKNGGMMIPIPATDKTKEFIIPVGKQDKWFIEDNDYISLTPQGGDVEVTLIKITRSK